MNLKNTKTNLDANVSPGNVTTGVPVHKTSIDVVCPLQRGVSKQTSANWPRRTCSSLAATFEKIILPGGRPVLVDRVKNKYVIRKTIKTHPNSVWSTVNSVHQRPESVAATIPRLAHSSKWLPTIAVSTDQFYTID